MGSDLSERCFLNTVLFRQLRLKLNWHGPVFKGEMQVSHDSVRGRRPSPPEGEDKAQAYSVKRVPEHGAPHVHLVVPGVARLRGGGAFATLGARTLWRPDCAAGRPLPWDTKRAARVRACARAFARAPRRAC